MKRVWFLSGVLALAFGSTASALTIADINASAAGTYCAASYGAGCFQIGDKIFRGLNVTGPTAVNNTNVTVSGEQIGDTVFIRFGGGFGASAVQGMNNDWQLSYDVQALGGLIASIDQSFVPTASGTSGLAAIGETVFSDAGHGNPVAQSSVSCLNGACDIADPPAEPIQGDSLIILTTYPGGTPNPLQRVWVQKDIQLVANVGGSVGATTINQSFHQVPEPAHAAFLLGACMIVGLYYKSRKRAQA